MEEVDRSDPSAEALGVLPSPRDLDHDMRALAAAVAVAEREEGAMVLPRCVSSAGGTPARLGATAGSGALGSVQSAGAGRVRVLPACTTALGVFPLDFALPALRHVLLAGSTDDTEGQAGAEQAAGAPGGMSSEAEERWKRMTYPAGRILHLVPACLRAPFSITSAWQAHVCKCHTRPLTCRLPPQAQTRRFCSAVQLLAATAGAVQRRLTRASRERAAAALQAVVQEMRSKACCACGGMLPPRMTRCHGRSSLLAP